MLDEKVVTRQAALHQIRAWQDAGEEVVFTNGCFDLLHAGHVRYLERARQLGDHLVIGINGDASVRALKGPSRPLQTEGDRAAILAALASVDLVVIYEEERALDLIGELKPDIYAKGGDYTLETMYRPERDLVYGYGGRVEIISLNGLNTDDSTSRIIQKIREAEE
jgi:rfaE bifunctional protein nucleotidyltransferase chain/domain